MCVPPFPRFEFDHFVLKLIWHNEKMKFQFTKSFSSVGHSKSFSSVALGVLPLLLHKVGRGSPAFHAEVWVNIAPRVTPQGVVIS